MWKQRLHDNKSDMETENIIEAILSMEDTAKKIEQLKNGRQTPLPDVQQLLKA